jgi:serine/threonine protein kinase
MIGDFGLSRITDPNSENMLQTLCGTPGYMSPELFLRKGHGKPVDLWAIGVITYYLLCGYAPFERDDDAAEVQAIVNADYSFTPVKYWEHASEESNSNLIY